MDSGLITQIVTVAALAVGAAVGFFQIKGYITKMKQDQSIQIQKMIDTSGDKVTSHFDEKVKLMDSKFTTYDTKLDKNEEDIQDVEVDMKNMVQEFKAMCDKLSKHDYIIDGIVPEFKSLQKEFTIFRTAFDNSLYLKKERNIVEDMLENRYRGSDKGNKENVKHTENNRDEIQE